MEKCTDIVPSEEAVAPNKDAPPPKKTSRNQLYVDEIRKRLDMYFTIVVRGIRDSVPKSIGFFLVQGIQDQIQYDLYAEINKNERMAETLGEPPEVTAERVTLNTSRETMQKALKVLQRDPEITATLDYDDELSRDIKESLKDEKKKQMRDKQGEEVKKISSSDSFKGGMSSGMNTSLDGSMSSTGKMRVDPNRIQREGPGPGPAYSASAQNQMPKGTALPRRPVQP